MSAIPTSPLPADAAARSDNQPKRSSGSRARNSGSPSGETHVKRARDTDADTKSSVLDASADRHLAAGEPVVLGTPHELDTTASPSGTDGAGGAHAAAASPPAARAMSGMVTTPVNIEGVAAAPLATACTPSKREMNKEGETEEGASEVAPMDAAVSAAATATKDPQCDGVDAADDTATVVAHQEQPSELRAASQAPMTPVGATTTTTETTVIEKTMTSSVTATTPLATKGHSNSQHQEQLLDAASPADDTTVTTEVTVTTTKTTTTRSVSATPKAAQPHSSGLSQADLDAIPSVGAPESPSSGLTKQPPIVAQEQEAGANAELHA